MYVTEIGPTMIRSISQFRCEKGCFFSPSMLVPGSLNSLIDQRNEKKHLFSISWKSFSRTKKMILHGIKGIFQLPTTTHGISPYPNDFEEPEKRTDGLMEVWNSFVKQMTCANFSKPSRSSRLKMGATQCK